MQGFFFFKLTRKPGKPISPGGPGGPTGPIKQKWVRTFQKRVANRRRDIKDIKITQFSYLAFRVYLVSPCHLNTPYTNQIQYF